MGNIYLSLGGLSKIYSYSAEKITGILGILGMKVYIKTGKLELKATKGIWVFMKIWKKRR